MEERKFESEEDVKKEIRRYKRYLKREDIAENTIISYTWTLEYYLSTYHVITNDTLLSYKSYLMENFKPRTVNQRIQAINKYVNWNNYKNINRLKSVKVQQKPFLENVISMQDYKFLKRKLKKDEEWDFYFLIWGMGCTGARISEILKIKVEDVVDGYIDFYGKGKKNRRIYFIRSYQKELLNYLEGMERRTGFVFLNKDEKIMTVKGVEKRIKHFAKVYGIDESVMYPHSFRHLFGKTFWDKEKDIVLLADIMGHASIETTRIYTRRTATEQMQIMNRVVTW